MALAQTSDGLNAAARAAAITQARTARAFEAARRHSRLVRVLRVALPLAAAGAVALLVGLTIVRHLTLPISGLSVGSLSVDGTKVTMESPKLTGGRPDGSSYVINARKAIQDIKNPSSVELVDIDGDIGSRNQATTKVTATSGHYDSTSETLALFGVVRLKNTSYTVDLKSADVDFKANLYSSREPIHVVTSSGMTIDADSAKAEENASKLSFLGHVRTMVPPQQERGEAPNLKSDTP